MIINKWPSHEQWIKSFTQKTRRSVGIGHLHSLLKDVAAHMRAKAPSCRPSADTTSRFDSPASTIGAVRPSPHIKVWDHQGQRGERLALANSPLSIIHQSSTILLFLARKDWFVRLLLHTLSNYRFPLQPLKISHQRWRIQLKGLR